MPRKTKYGNGKQPKDELDSAESIRRDKRLLKIQDYYRKVCKVDPQGEYKDLKRMSCTIQHITMFLNYILHSNK